MGKAKNLKKRVASYQRSSSLGAKTARLVEKIYRIEHTVVASELEALLLEANLIKKYSPPYNVAWKDGRAYPFIKITINDKYPVLLQGRKIDDNRAKYFGPYPNIGDVSKILKMLRRIFPYQGVKNHPKKVCLYYHLGLCPCPPVFDSRELQKKYRRHIRMIISLLEGKKEYVLSLLTRSMKSCAKSENFEEAGLIRKQIITINLITQPLRNPIEYMQNPNLISDEAALDLEALQDVLKKQGIPTDSLSRIECYDISNIQGKQATGSMVVATNGIIDQSQYRLFRIKLKNTPDDVAMLREVIQRRLKHTEWPQPKLFVVDGGINQVQAVRIILDQNAQNLTSPVPIPVIGLAKRLEEIITKFETILLPRNNRALKLLQRLRDEAHRFALAYHRKLRKKSILGMT